LTLLKEEYFFLQKAYEDFDSRALTVKGWSATVALAAIGVGFYQSPYLWLFAAGASLAFWLIEAQWKTFQYCYGDRIRLLEQAFREGTIAGIAPLQVHAAWGARWRTIRLHRQFLNALVLIPHMLTFVVGLGLFILWQLGWFTLATAR
jgi:hypothetical protein